VLDCIQLCSAASHADWPLRCRVAALPLFLCARAITSWLDPHCEAGGTNSYSERGTFTQQRHLPLDSDMVELK